MAQSEWKKKAVIIGATYVHSKVYRLYGPANDAHIFAYSLIHLLGFRSKDIVLLCDSLPARCYSSNFYLTCDSSLSSVCASAQSSNSVSVEGDESLYQCDSANILFAKLHPLSSIHPTRRNILAAVNWLVRESKPGDVLIFYYCGHGIQVDNLAGWEGEGYDEAILPIDAYSNSCEQENDCLFTEDHQWNVITTIQLKEILLCIDSRCQLTIILDCNGGQTILDPAGTNSIWKYIKGIKQKGFWPFLTNPTNKMNRAVYNPDVWMSPEMQSQNARPRYVPGVDIDNTDALVDPLLQQAGHPSLNATAFCMAAAPWGQVAMEATFPSISIKGLKNAEFIEMISTPVIHGVFTYALVKSLVQLYSLKRCHTKCFGISYKKLINTINSHINELKETRLHKLDQVPELTLQSGTSASPLDYFGIPWGGMKSMCAKLSSNDDPSYGVRDVVRESCSNPCKGYIFKTTDEVFEDLNAIAYKKFVADKVMSSRSYLIDKPLPSPTSSYCPIIPSRSILPICGNFSSPYFSNFHSLTTSIPYESWLDRGNNIVSHGFHNQDNFASYGCPITCMIVNQDSPMLEYISYGASEISSSHLDNSNRNNNLSLGNTKLNLLFKGN